MHPVISHKFMGFEQNPVNLWEMSHGFSKNPTKLWEIYGMRAYVR